ncbi:MAG: PASTA domain-containing protein [Clostridiales bacterium]|nr:PASTA domain-containing protein [Clostridiales bacterium]
MKKRINLLLIVLVAISICLSGCRYTVTKNTEDNNTEKQETAASEESESASDAVDVTASATEEVKESTAEAVTESTAEVSTETTETTTEAKPETTTETTTEAATEATTEATTETTTEATTETTAADPSEKPQGSPCQVLFDITYNENIALAKYSVVLYLDGEKVDTIEHGKFYLNAVSTTAGEHEVRLEKRGDDSCATTLKLTISGDCTLILEITSHLSEIEINNSRKVDSLMETDVEMPDVTEMRLDKAIETLTEAGFRNISTESEKIIIIRSNWVVISQNAKAGQMTNRATEIVLTCEKDA